MLMWASKIMDQSKALASHIASPVLIGHLNYMTSKASYLTLFHSQRKKGYKTIFAAATNAILFAIL